MSVNHRGFKGDPELATARLALLNHLYPRTARDFFPNLLVPSRPPRHSSPGDAHPSTAVIQELKPRTVKQEPAFGAASTRTYPVTLPLSVIKMTVAEAVGAAERQVSGANSGRDTLVHFILSFVLDRDAGGQQH